MHEACVLFDFRAKSEFGDENRRNASDLHRPNESSRTGKEMFHRQLAGVAVPHSRSFTSNHLFYFSLGNVMLLIAQRQYTPRRYECVHGVREYEFVVKISCMQPSIRFAGTSSGETRHFCIALVQREFDERKKKRKTKATQRSAASS